jgi:hypothetical protein
MYAQVVMAQRINPSVYGNPNWEFVLIDEDANFHRVRTSANLSQSFTVENDGGMINKDYIFKFTRSGRISGWTKV